MPILSIITAPFRFLKRRLYDEPIERRAEALFVKMMVVYEKDEEHRLKLEHRARAEDDERQKLAAAFQPFKTKRLTNGQVKQLIIMDEQQLQALEVIGDELRAELTNRAIYFEGTARDKAMWTMVGINLLLEQVRDRIKRFSDRQERDRNKEKAKAEASPKEVPRSIMDLYSDTLMKRA
jgi:hypothetical protein